MTTITSLPPAPSRSDPTTFSDRSDALLGALDGFVSETNTVAGEVIANKNASATSATAAAGSATTATTQAGIATTQAGLATTQANTATTQAGTATTQAGLATTQANTATTQAGIATTKAGEANSSAIAAAASVASIAGGPVASVNGRTGVVTGVQDSLVSGTSIKTVNSTPLLGSGDVAVAALGANTFTGVQSFISNGCTIKGSSTGKTTFSSANSSATDYTITFPASTGTVLTTATAVTVAQGGTGVGTLTGLAKGNGTSAFSAAVAGTDYVSPTGLDGTVTRQMLKDCGQVYYDSSATNALDYVNGACQRWAPNTGAQTLTISNWPPTGNLGELLIQGINLGAATITWPTINWVKSDGTTTTTFSSNGVTLQSSGTDWVFLWTRDAGTTIYGKVVR